MKKLSLLLLAIAFVFMFASCTGNHNATSSHHVSSHHASSHHVSSHAAPEDTAMKEYIGTQYIVRYPHNWTETANVENEVEFSGPREDNFTPNIKIYIKSTDTEIINADKNGIKESKYVHGYEGYVSDSVEKMKIDGVEGLRAIGTFKSGNEELKHAVFFVNHNNHLYQIDYTDSIGNFRQSTVDGVVESFKFK